MTVFPTTKTRKKTIPRWPFQNVRVEPLVRGSLRASTAADKLGANIIGRPKGIDMVREMTEIFMEFDDESHPIENLSIKLNSFKILQNATYSDCASACLLSHDIEEGDIVVVRVWL
mmetsp:Transcript_24679/g.54114  ORF Transcript_24679/g.54114 Transcript_24679/m.54114 type:complete len:116 (+) Transcript_24679:101-448(+)